MVFLNVCAVCACSGGDMLTGEPYAESRQGGTTGHACS